MKTLVGDPEGPSSISPLHRLPPLIAVKGRDEPARKIETRYGLFILLATPEASFGVERLVHVAR